ncbi:NADH-quinone oxidoreductase subunit C [Ferrimicrobium acidiphilum]|uniref:NADH-quinone oxidoreductase subunit 5 n=1 Tax=Ferrimicrobium acidiphilum DSM 19497 TaxID=1121877 RepID=A0A0D8FWJ9_9ACTN|nr:NADH-quinone oxidoreductase subunit C [Ferrimicrobium acidiphilum]KJE77673.1 NADH-quinone oxidoreductase subunit 5 [Ferrimicrobium acidiphilum DSM 19497]
MSRILSDVIILERSDYLSTVEARHQAGYIYLADITCVDYLNDQTRAMTNDLKLERFELVVNLRSFAPPAILRLRVQIPEQNPVAPSIFALYPGAEAMEREVYDLFGIRFENHPDLTRILLPEDWEGHPLRKDYGVGRVPVQFKEVKRNR